MCTPSIQSRCWRASTEQISPDDFQRGFHVKSSTKAADTTAVRKISFRKAINEALAQAMREDESVIVLGEDVAGGAGLEEFENDDAWGGTLGVTKGLVAEFGRRRVIDTPLSETAFLGATVGASMTGLRPVVEIMFSEFLGVCLDQLMNQGSKARYMFGGQASLPLTVRTTIGGGMSAAAQHSGCHYSMLTHLPGLKTVVPSNAVDAKGLLLSAIKDPDPVVFFEHKLLYDETEEVPEGLQPIPIGPVRIAREGSDVTIVAIGRMVRFASEAAGMLALDGIEAEVIDLHTLSPLDTDGLARSFNKTGRVVFVDEDNPRCSMLGDISFVAQQHAFSAMKAPVAQVTAPHAPSPFSPELESLYIPSVDRIVTATKAVMRSS